MGQRISNVPLAVSLGNGVPFGYGASVWIATLSPVLVNRKILGYAVNGGPQSSNLAVFFDATMIDTTPYAVRNIQEHVHGKVLFRGAVMRIIWSLGTGTSPTATVDYELER